MTLIKRRQMDLIGGTHPVSMYGKFSKRIIIPFFKKLKGRKESITGELYWTIGMKELSASCDEECKDFDILRHQKYDILIKYLIMKFDHALIFINMKSDENCSLTKIGSLWHIYQAN